MNDLSFKNLLRNRYLFVAVVTTIAGEFYFNPFGSDFRITFGVLIFGFMLIYYRDISIPKASGVTALVLFSVRTALFTVSQGSLVEAVVVNLPAMIFYITYGMLMYAFHFRELLNTPFVFLIVMGFVDFFSNLVELVFRGDLFVYNAGEVFTKLFIIGYTRGFFTMLFYLIFNLMRLTFEKEERQRKYEDLLVLSSNVRTAAFILGKSMFDIENAMTESYDIYSYLKRQGEFVSDQRVLDKALSLTKDIHEIKKDNKRILHGIQSIIPPQEMPAEMTLQQIVELVVEVNRRYDPVVEKWIRVDGACEVELSTKEYFSLISVVNNLVINAVEASSEYGKIEVSGYVSDGAVWLTVLDNGSGIAEDDLEFIFDPGFSTKFDVTTGRMSTGIGLSHAKHIITEVFDGTITVKSTEGKGSEFNIAIPVEHIGGI